MISFSCFIITIYLLRRVFRVRIKCIDTTQIELPDELFSYATIVSQSMTSVDVLSCNGILSWSHFFPIYTSDESSLENGLRVFIITFEISLHAHLQNVLKYDYLIMKTIEGSNFFNMTLKTIFWRLMRELYGVASVSSR